MGQPILGKRIRYFRKEANLTLDQMSKKVGRTSSYLSQLENGMHDPRTSLVESIAEVVGCTVEDINDLTPPTRRDELEIAVAAAQEHPRYAELHLPFFRPSARTPDEVLEHISTLFDALVESDRLSQINPGDDQRQANNDIRKWMRDKNNYFGEIEDEATRVLDAINYPGHGPISDGMLTAIVGEYGFTVEKVLDVPRTARSVTDQRERKIYIPSRNESTTRASRSNILQTLGHFVLGHRDSDDFGDYVRQRVESNYFAAAVLAPEKAAVEFLEGAHTKEDISVEDLREIFYISYEMAAHRLTNLATEHLDLTLHFIRSDEEGVVWKAYENNGVPLPADPDGTVEGHRLCREWGTRQAFDAEDAYNFHYQWTSTDSGDYWCVTFVEADRRPRSAVTVGTDAAQAKYFRGSNTERHTVSKCPDPSCCREPDQWQRQRWRGVAWPSATDRSHVLSGLPTDRPKFSKFPGVDMVEVYQFLDRHSR